ncbi:MAG: Hpt domain-containing protein [Lachnospira eligens]
MTIKECYDAMGADYQNTLNRFPNEAFIKKFVLKFLDDNSYANLKEAIAAGNVEEAFRAAHTLKGVCLNLGLIIFIKRVQLLQRFFVQENSQELRKHLKKLRNSTI